MGKLGGLFGAAANDGDPAFWQSYVQKTHQSTTRLQRAQSDSALPPATRAVGHEKRPPKKGAVSMQRSVSDVPLPPLRVRAVDKYSRIAVLQAQASQLYVLPETMPSWTMEARAEHDAKLARDLRRARVRRLSPPKEGVLSRVAMDGRRRDHSRAKPAVIRAAEPSPSSDAQAEAGEAARKQARKQASKQAAWEARLRLRGSRAVDLASGAVHSRYTNMHKAFQFVDLDRTGKLSRAEIARALELWNVPIDEGKLDEVFAACGTDAERHMSYDEFVDLLARDTVADAALGKRGMQAVEAMGVDEFARRKVVNERASINEGRAARVNEAPTEDNADLVAAASTALNAKFADMFKAFQFVDVDRSGTLDETEIFRALDLWNIPMTRSAVKGLIRRCDADADGAVNYEEFVDALARDTVAIGAMGKRGP